MPGVVAGAGAAFSAVARCVCPINLSMGAAQHPQYLNRPSRTDVFAPIRDGQPMIKPIFEQQWHRLDALILYNKVIDLLFKLLIFFVVLVLAMGLVKMFLE